MATATDQTRVQQGPWGSPRDLPQLLFSQPVRGLREAHRRFWENSESSGLTGAALRSLLVLWGPRAHPVFQPLLQQEWEPQGDSYRVKSLVSPRVQV